MQRQRRRSGPLLFGCGGCLLVMLCACCCILAGAVYLYAETDGFANLDSWGSGDPAEWFWSHFYDWDPSALATPAPANPGDPPAQPNDSPSDPAGGPVLGTGDVQVTLRWDSAADLDLRVIDPDGVKVTYGIESSPSGGRLDVDANGACEASEMMASPVENIFWPEGGAPEGVFRVLVTYWEDCEGVGPASFTVRVLVDGTVQEYAGTVHSVDDVYEVVEFTRGATGK